MQMLIKIAFVLLASASVLLCECSKSNELTALNDYLVDTVKSVDLEENLQAAKKFAAASTEPNRGGQLAKLVSSLHPTDLCSGFNLKTLRASVEAVLKCDKSSFQAPKVDRRLNNLLAKYIYSAWTECLPLFEQKYRADRELSTRLYTEYDNTLSRLDSFNLRASGYKSSTNDEVTWFRFKGALHRLASASYFWIPFLGSDVKDMLEDMHTAATGKTEIQLNEKTGKREWRGIRYNEETGRKEPLTLEAAKSYLNEYLFKPCKSLIEDERVQDVLAPLIDLGTTVFMVNPQQQNKQTGHSYALVWSSRTVGCQWALKKGIDKLAKMIQK